jgi:hypothetical protein
MPSHTHAATATAFEGNDHEPSTLNAMPIMMTAAIVVVQAAATNACVVGMRLVTIELLA